MVCTYPNDTYIGEVHTYDVIGCIDTAYMHVGMLYVYCILILSYISTWPMCTQHWIAIGISDVHVDGVGISDVPPYDVDNTHNFSSTISTPLG
jgi:hypothetical protein